MDAAVASRATAKIAELAVASDDLARFWRACGDVLADTVPHFRSPCWFTLDPASLIMTSHFQSGLTEFPPEWAAQEYADDGDVHHLADVARSRSGISTLHEATGGRPETSARWHSNMVYGGDQELMAALRARDGRAWGVMSLYREPDRPAFAPDELRFVRTVAPMLADGARRGLLMGEARDPEGPGAPGLVVLDDRWCVESSSPEADRWLLDLPDGRWAAGRLPTAVLAVAGRAASITETPGTADRREVAVARVLTRSGTWVVLHGVPLAAQGGRRVAVIVEPARPERIAPLLMAAYQLTRREQELTRLVLTGCSTAEIAAALVISPHTVQQHLKSVFDKTGVRSRRELVSSVFLAHYEPRLRDNERRTGEQRPMRGGPMPGTGRS
ncbi:helix-turn-helix transcriptional regulator [Isoptericola croceus]|uniref:helix-turn-helix transcriptional regulator n=1 Tax=Isoptericola croceus TaxID=3031406 RepID=UPI0023F646BB|nr:LuxR C-terminal-related transcriptional regulator [Isoptericola croceus]